MSMANNVLLRTAGESVFLEMEVGISEGGDCGEG